MTTSRSRSHPILSAAACSYPSLRPQPRRLPEQVEPRIRSRNDDKVLLVVTRAACVDDAGVRDRIVPSARATAEE